MKRTAEQVVQEWRDSGSTDWGQLVSAINYWAMTDMCPELNAAASLGGAAEPGEISDGYHTFNELYEHRHALFSVICATFNGWKAQFHEDGTMFDGWFIAGVDTPLGMATYHLPIAWWERFRCTARKLAPKWDGHTAQQVPERIAALASERESGGGA